MNILMVSSEAVPFAKAGGLGDAVPALARAMNKNGHTVGIVMPRYYSIDRRSLKKLNQPLGVPMGIGEMWCTVYETRLPESNVSVWMLEREDLYGRHGIYGPDGSRSWPDNALRYAFLCAASFQLSRYLKRIPDIIHLHDWPAAPAAWLLKNRERSNGFERTASVLTIHNLGHQGRFPISEAKIFPHSTTDVARYTLLQGRELNYLAAGIHNTDAVNTVSPTYAREIMNPDYPHGLGKTLSNRTDKIKGILNGMDYGEWNPSRDTTLSPHNYSHWTLWRKNRLKARLQMDAGLPLNAKIPLFGMITRLTAQKGIDLMEHPFSPALDAFRESKAQLVLLGTGEKRYEQAMARFNQIYPENCSIRIEFSESYSRLIEAGADFFIMPSRYEPCGLNQMYSLRYGTLPLVRHTGGLADTVIDLDEHPETGNGFTFAESESRELADTIERAMAFYKNKRRMKTARKRAMKLRFDWNSSSESYMAMYRNALKRIGAYSELAHTNEPQEP